MKTDPTLLVLAAGMGSRYGGLKQIDSFGPNGETILDYSIYDAIDAGFKKVVFVVRRHFLKDIKAFFYGKFDDRIDVQYVTQELDKVPSGVTVHPQREKPWGTAHAVGVAKDVIHEPFCVINADDFYGRDAYFVMSAYFKECIETQSRDYALVGYDLVNTLSEFGTVNRGVCTTDGKGYLNAIVETLSIGYDEGKAIVHPGPEGRPVHLQPQIPVSMNMWGFFPDYFEFFDASFKRFLESKGRELKSEYFIPLMIDELIKSNRKRVAVLHSSATWFGVTYQKDKPFVMNRLNRLIEDGIYPRDLWS